MTFNLLTRRKFSCSFNANNFKCETYNEDKIVFCLAIQSYVNDYINSKLTFLFLLLIIIIRKLIQSNKKDKMLKKIKIKIKHQMVNKAA